MPRCLLNTKNWFRLFSLSALLALLASFAFGVLAQANRAAAQSSSPSSTPVRETKPACLPVSEAMLRPNQDVCVSAHVYDVVESRDGTRFLDLCPSTVPDAQCGFTVLTPAADREDVGDLRRLRDRDVKIRGIVRQTHGRMGIVLSHFRQFNGGPEKFHPNPKLLRGFSADSDRMPVRDPNLSGSGHPRAFMNDRQTEPLPQPK